MTIIRAHFLRTVGIHKAGNTYLIEDAELAAALAEDALDVERVEIVKPGPLTVHGLMDLVRDAELARLAPEIPAVEDPAPGSPDEAVFVATIDPPGGDA